MGRTVTLVLLDAAGDVLGALPPYELDFPHWPETGDVADAARRRDGIEVQVLRLLFADRPHPPEGHVTLLAQTARPPAGPLIPVHVDRRPHPLRAPWAEPGGPAASVRWAVGALADAGRPGAVAVQYRTWNLSALWRLEIGGTPVAWLKQVPAFFAHEATVLRLLADVAPGLAPELLATGPHGRQLLEHVPGEDRYGADAGFCAAVAAGWHPVQAHLAGRTGELVAAGVPDRRSPLDRLIAVAAPYHDTPGLAELMAGLPGRLSQAAACGLPDTLVHGDLHPGNVRADGASHVIVDWGDAYVGSPAYDILRLTGGLPPADAGRLIAAWAHRWHDSAPGSDPQRAVALLRPVAELLAAATYRAFLDAIEPSEWPYHADDVPAALVAAVAASGASRTAGIP